MRRLLLALALIASPAGAQIFNPSTGGAAPDLSGYATKAEVQAAADAATAAQNAAVGAVKTINGLSPTNGAVTMPIPAAPDLTPYVRTVNGATPVSGNVAIAIPSTTGLATTTALNAVAATVPTASTVAPPSVGDASAQGTMTTVYALANHTHASKARRGIVTTATDGTVTVTFSPSFAGVPVCAATAQTAAGVTDIVNAQLDGAPTATSAKFRANRSVATATILNLVSVTVPVLQASPGAQIIHYVCIES